MSSNSTKSTPPEAHKIQRRDASGHIDPQYAKELLAKSGHSTNTVDDNAFLGGELRSDEELSETLGENFVESATSGEESSADHSDELSEAERGGPYVLSTDKQEFAVGTDPSNPEGATREPFPTT